MLKQSPYIIAEAGVNHNGDINKAKKLIEAAAIAGADAIKFQTFKAKELVVKNTEKADYQKRHTNQRESQLEMLRRYELSAEVFHELYNFCKESPIEFISSPFDLESIELLHAIGIDRFKIPSGEITNLPYLERIGRLNKEVIMSSGMAYLEEVQEALNVLIQSGTPKEKVIVLHTNTQYPSPFKDVNLTAMLTIRDTLKVKVGYSDHTTGYEIALAAAALGAEVIEKHFTLDRNDPGPDHQASIIPEELNSMVDAIRNIKLALGNGIKEPSESEVANKKLVRKSIVATRKIKKGELFTSENVGTKRPGTGISPMQWYRVLGSTATKDYLEDDLIE